MIKSKEDYVRYLETDRLAIYVQRKKPRPFIDDTIKYTRTMRKLEFYENCKAGFFSKLMKLYLKYKLYNLSIKTQFSIPPHVFEEGLTLFHHGTIIVNDTARIGKYCQLHCCTNIASGVEIGDHVFIAPGVKILNNVKIADGVRIGANSVVSRSITEPNITVVGSPARKVSNIGSDRKSVKKKDGEYYLEVNKFISDKTVNT